MIKSWIVLILFIGGISAFEVDISDHSYHVTDITCPNITIVLTIPLDEVDVLYTVPNGWETFETYRDEYPLENQTLHSIYFKHPHPLEFETTLTSTLLSKDHSEFHLIQIHCQDQEIWDNWDPGSRAGEEGINYHIFGIVGLTLWTLFICILLYSCRRPKSLYVVQDDEEEENVDNV